MKLKEDLPAYHHYLRENIDKATGFRKALLLQIAGTALRAEIAILRIWVDLDACSINPPVSNQQVSIRALLPK